MVWTFDFFVGSVASIGFLAAISYYLGSSKLVPIFIGWGLLVGMLLALGKIPKYRVNIGGGAAFASCIPMFVVVLLLEGFAAHDSGRYFYHSGEDLITTAIICTVIGLIFMLFFKPARAPWFVLLNILLLGFLVYRIDQGMGGNDNGDGYVTDPTMVTPTPDYGAADFSMPDASAAAGHFDATTALMASDVIPDTSIYSLFGGNDVTSNPLLQTFGVSSFAGVNHQTLYNSFNQVAGSMSTDSMGTMTLYDAGNQIAGRMTVDSSGGGTIFDAANQFVGRTAIDSNGNINLFDNHQQLVGVLKKSSDGIVQIFDSLNKLIGTYNNGTITNAQNIFTGKIV